MRPRGVRLRVEELRGLDARRDRAEPERARGRALAWFVHGCALLDLDVATSGVVELYREVLALLDDPAQHRTGSHWERAVLCCVDQLREPLAEVAADPHRHASRDERLALAPLVEIPPQVLIGPGGAERSFPTACRNAAGALLDGMISPYPGRRVRRGCRPLPPGPGARGDAGVAGPVRGRTGCASHARRGDSGVGARPGRRPVLVRPGRARRR